MSGPRRAEYDASRARVGVTTERVWLQATPMGDFAVVYLEAADIGKVFEGFLTSQDPFDQWFRDKILIGVHGMDPTAPPPPMNEPIFASS
jgi:hypothetical protein